MTWISIGISEAKDYVGEMDVKCIEMCDIAEKHFPDCKNIQYFDYHPSEKIFYYVTNLKSWCGNGKWYKIDFYRFESNYFLCLKRINNEIFVENALPSKIRQGIKNLFPNREMKDDNCILLMKAVDKEKIVAEFRRLMNYLKDVNREVIEIK